MTNAEKFEEVFGFEHDNPCPYEECKDSEGDTYETCEDCLNDFWECEYQGKPTKTDLISKEEALELFPLILSGESLSIGTVREQLRELQTVEAVSLSVIEQITETMEVEYASADELADWFSDGDKTEASFYRGKASGIEWVKGIIDKAVKECTHE